MMREPVNTMEGRENERKDSKNGEKEG